MLVNRATPVTILTGFLGSGKTTLLRSLLHHPDLKDTAVIINEFGEIALDHILVEAVDHEVVLLPQGCLCCSGSGDLADTLHSLWSRRASRDVPNFTRILIETSGLADPSPVMQTLFQQRLLATGLYLDRVVTIVDAVNGTRTLDQHDVSVQQVAVADCIIVSKTDVAKPSDTGELRSRIAALNADAPTYEVVAGGIAPHLLLEASSGANESKKNQGAAGGLGRLHNHTDHDHFHRVSIASDRALSWQHFRNWLERLIAEFGEDLLRTKGVLYVSGEERPVVVHGVQHVFHPIYHLPRWPDGIRQTRLTMIARDIDERQLVASFNKYVLAFS